MIKFLLKRPIAVLMSFLALVVLGLVTFTALPVSLLPDVAIPHIAVQADAASMSAREIENTVTAPLRRELMQVGGLADIRSETRDGSALIFLDMDYGVDTDLAFIEVNEKIDAAMGAMPRTVSRPRAVKGTVSDIPVVYLQMTPSDTVDLEVFYNTARDIVRRRLEQLPEVAMVDVTGIPARQLRLTPDGSALRAAGLTVADLEKTLARVAGQGGAMTVHDGQYEYAVQVANAVTTQADVAALPIMKGGRVYTVEDFCKVEIAETTPGGLSTYGGRPAVTMAVIKKSDAGMNDLSRALDESVGYFRTAYPGINFDMSRSQTELLDFSIGNLEQDLVMGLILVFGVCLLFMRSGRMPLVIGITIVVSVVITFLIFFLFGVSINIISLAGLILAVGMMIDNMLIVTENITQFRDRGLTLARSCILGTVEMITPMLSSSLTTVAVFAPLVFMSGIAGAIFADQAFSITAGLAASNVTGITLLPVLYYLFYRKVRHCPATVVEETKPTYARWYRRGVDWTFAHPRLSTALVILTVAAMWPLLQLLEVERMPRFDTAETVLDIDWNENISVAENGRRTAAVESALDSLLLEHSALVGRPDFMLGTSRSRTSTESQLYLRARTPEELAPMQAAASALLQREYPAASYRFGVPEGVFDRVFGSDEAALEVRLSPRGRAPMPDDVAPAASALTRAAGQAPEMPAQTSRIEIAIDGAKALQFGVDRTAVVDALSLAFKGVEVAALRSGAESLPVTVAFPAADFSGVLATTMVDASGGRPAVPLNQLVSVRRAPGFKTVTAGAAGEYVPLRFARADDSTVDAVKAEIASEEAFDVALTGSVFFDAEMMSELAVILLVSVLMMYFILCAQFESFLQPLIVLVEVPVDISFALLTLYLCGHTLNLMSAIGIIVTCGIVVNDSILKLDSINAYRAAGMPLLEAIHTAGDRRLKAIIMTSLTTVLSMAPVLFTSDMGSELQQPMALAMVGSMVPGTIVSIFVIPLFYYLIYRKHEALAH